MNWNNVKELLNINFLYAHPQVAAQVQAQHAKKAKKSTKKFSAIKAVRNQFLWLSLVFFVLYSVMFIGLDYTKSAGYFSVQLGLFSLISLATGFNSLFSVFYDSKDTKLYLSLPVKSEEVYLAKLLAAQPAIITYLLPLLSLLAIASWQVSSPVVAILVSLPMFLLLLLAINAISLLLLDTIGEVLVKSRHKKLISTGLVILTTILSIALIYMVQFSSTNIRLGEGGGLLTAEILYFIGFYKVLVSPFSLDTLLQFWLPNALILGLGAYVLKVVIPKYFDQMLKISANQGQVTRKQKVNSKERGLKETIIRHHLSTLKDGNLLTQSFLMPLIIGFSGFMPIIAKGGDFSGLDSGYYGVALITGVIFGTMTTGATSLLSVGISLERENLNFIRTLPLNFRDFLRSKFYTLLVVQVAPILAIHLLVGLFVFRLPLTLLLAYALGHLAADYLTGLVVYKRDYRLLELNWQNITQLFSRGHGQWLFALTMFGTLILGMAIIISSMMLSRSLSPYSVSLGLTALVILGFSLVYGIIGRGFWKTFQND